MMSLTIGNLYGIIERANYILQGSDLVITTGCIIQFLIQHFNFRPPVLA